MFATAEGVAVANSGISRNSIKRETFSILCDRGIKTPEELDFLFQEYLGFNLPKKQICPNHKPPFDIICDLFFNKPPIALWISSRGSGKTLDSALLDIAELMTSRGLSIIHSAAILTQTEQAYEYFLRALRDDCIKARLEGEHTRTYTQFKNGSNVSLITMTLQGTNSPHVPRLTIDEAELIRDWEVLQEALYIPQSQNGYKAQTVMLSTRKWHNGIVQRLVDEAEEKNIVVYESCIFEVLEKCLRECQDDPVYGNCPAFRYCNGTAHNCEVFYKINDFVHKILQLDDETLDAQYFCRKPIGYKGGAVYDLIDNVHVVDWNYFRKMTGYDRPPESWKRIGGVDFESVFVYNMAAIEPMTGRRWLYAEHYWDSSINGMKTFSEHAEKIDSLEGWSRNVRAWADPSGKQEIFELVRNGIPCYKSPKMAIKTGVDEVRRLLRVNDVLKTPLLLFIKEAVPETIKSMRSWAFFRNPDGTVDYDNFMDEDDHGADAVRYMMYGHKCRSLVVPSRGRGLY